MREKDLAVFKLDLFNFFLQWQWVKFCLFLQSSLCVAGGLEATQPDNEDPGVVLINVWANRMAAFCLSFFLQTTRPACPGGAQDQWRAAALSALSLLCGRPCKHWEEWQVNWSKQPHHNTWGHWSGVVSWGSQGTHCVSDSDWAQREITVFAFRELWWLGVSGNIPNNSISISTIVLIAANIAMRKRQPSQSIIDKVCIWLLTTYIWENYVIR